ncbi:hypothetical protein O1611_g3497 [Lasiodiplodia mahajangana]|uniref:Uncharacterized protein n=1 Tax=Lasiodiplodia mahajangana TaxID=1108764 RepID=A0ACC2JRM1_9PEZI|nr:hypothetical protein O1611_g3497 [Lasiodiplodia mahajangana]
MSVSPPAPAAAPASDTTLRADLPAFNDPNITTDPNRLDAFTRDIENIKRDLTLSLTQSLTQSIKDDLTQSLTQVVRQDYADLERRLKTYAAARERNGIVRTRNKNCFQARQELEALHSVFTNMPIVNFPKTVARFKKLKEAEVVQILRELDDPSHQQDYGTSCEKWQRLVMLTGLRLSDDPILLGPADSADAVNGDGGDDVASDADE